MLPLRPFLFGGRAGDFSRGFILEGPPRAAWRHERASGSGPLWDFACEREQDDELFGPTRIQRQRETNVEHHCQADDVWASLEVAQGLRGCCQTNANQSPFPRPQPSIRQQKGRATRRERQRGIACRRGS